MPASMDDPRDIEIPSLESLQAMIAKNKENWFDDGNSPLFPGNSRKYVKINTCPFAAKNPRGGESCKTCSKQNFSGAALWSTQTPLHCLGYLMQHGTHSEWHKLSPEDAYDTLVGNWQDIDWELCSETYEEREQYRAQMQLEQEKKQRENKRKHQADASSEVHPHDSASQVHPMSDTCKVIAETVRQTLEASAGSVGQPAAAAARAHVWGTLGQPRPTSRPALSSGSGVQTLSLGSLTGGPSHVSVPVERMQMMQDSLQRAEHAISASLAFTVEQSTKLAHERLIVQNAIEVISKITGNDTCHFGGLE